MFGLRAPHGIQVQLEHQAERHAVLNLGPGIFQQSLECCPCARDRTVTGAPFREVHQQRADTTPVFPSLAVNAPLSAPAVEVFPPCVRRIGRTVEKVLYFLRSGTFKTFKSDF